MSKFSADNLRLFIKLVVVSWVPIAVVGGFVSWDAQTTALIMAASTATVDAAFRVFGVGTPSS